MKKNTTFSNLIRKFVSLEKLDLLEKAAIGYKDVAREMDVGTLISTSLPQRGVSGRVSDIVPTLDPVLG